MALKYSDEEIAAAIDAYLCGKTPRCPLRVKYVAYEVMGCKTKIPSVLSSRIRVLARERGYVPDPEDHTKETNNRLYPEGRP